MATATIVSAAKVQLNETEFRDRVYACWMGKNIGGTLGMPFEGNRQVNDITFYTDVKSGEPTANDDLDLQLLWLKAMEDHGGTVDARILGEYWLKHVPVDWNEYGVGKRNMQRGLLPPLSGHFQNEHWRRSNGAWIRSEIWACLAPGCPGLAARMAREDACVDHGAAEGTLAEIFTAAVESAAFIEHDRDKLIAIGLSMIPPECGVARAVRAAIEAKRAGKDWRAAREAVIATTEDTGWFQAPRNVAFTMIGWLYGGDDFGTSLCIAVNCGDDTDCTGATLGSILGIIHGTNGIPKKWIEPIGTQIKTVAIAGIEHPRDIAVLTDSTIAMTRKVLAQHNAPVALTTGPTDLSRAHQLVLADTAAAKALWALSPYDIVWNEKDAQVVLGYLADPVITAGQPRAMSATIRNRASSPRAFSVKVEGVPAGWKITGLPSSPVTIRNEGTETFSFSIVAPRVGLDDTRMTLEVTGGSAPIRIPLVLCSSPQPLGDPLPELKFSLDMDGAKVVTQPYPVVTGGAFDGPVVKESPDPLVGYRWTKTKADDGLQVYALRPVAAVADTTASFSNLDSATAGKTDITVNGVGSIRFDFGVESAAWLEFDSPDCPGAVEMSISEYNQPAIVNAMPLHPVKTLAPVKYGNTYRLELNKVLYEGVRFGWIHVRSFTGVWHITGIRLVCQVKPVNYKGSFSCSDAMLARMWYTGAYGVKLNLLKDYMGAILMDRGDRHSWTGDSHPSQAASMVAFGNFDFIRDNLERTSGKDWILSYMLYWVSSLLDYYNYTGDAELLKKYTENISAKLDDAYTAYGTNPQLGFYGWDERLAGFEVQSRNCPEAQNAYKMLSIRAWNDFAKAMGSIGRTDLRDKYNGYVTEKVSQLRQNATWYQDFGVHAMTDAVNAGFTSRPEQEEMCALEFNDKVNRVSFSPFNQYFIIQAMASMKKHDDALDTVRYLWGGMIAYGGTTFFETFRPAWATALGKNDPIPNNQCGFTSLCHPWGGGVVKWLSEEVLGIKPVSPGFKEYDIIPHLGRSLTWVKGTVPTPHGDIGMSINVDSGKMSMSAPAGTTGRLGIPKMEKTIHSVAFDNAVVWDGVFHSANGVGGAEEDADFVYLTKIQPGTHAVSVKYSGITPGYVETLEHYDVDFIKQDSVTGGSWGGKYGAEGYVLCSYNGADVRALPSYVTSIDYSRHNSVQWTNQTSDLRALSPDKSNGVPRKAACIYTGNGGPTDIVRGWNGQPLTVAIEVNGTRSYQVALYFVDWDKLGRSIAVEMFDAKTLKMVAPVQVIKDHVAGCYLIYQYDKSVKFRIQQIRGANAALGGIFFDPAAVDAPMGVERVARPTARNYISPAVTNNDTVCWVQVDLGRSLPIDKVKLFPIIEWGWLYAAGDKREFFPIRFKIEASDDSELKSASIVTDQTGADYTNIPDAVIIFPGNSTTGRYVRLTATRLSDQKLALMKVEVWSGGTNVAEGCPVADSFKGNLGVTNLTLKRRPQDDVVTDNPGNVIPADQWKPVAYKAQAPLGGVHLADGLFKTAMQNNIAYLMNTFTVDEMVREFRTRAGKPNPEGMREPEEFWDTGLAGQNAGRFLMGAGNTLRWMEDPALRTRMNDIVDVIEECREPDGYIMAFPTSVIFQCERAGYTRAWVTHGLIDAGYAGNPKAFPLLRGFYDWFNHSPYLPELLRRPNQSQQGTVANTRFYFTPIGKAEDLQVVQRYFQENYWLDQLAKRDTDAIWKYPYDRPHCYLLTAIEPYLDLYRATGKRDYFEAAMGGWELYHDNWEHIGGSIAICEGGGPYPPKSYIFRCTGELCGSVFMARLSQRFHLLDPEQEKYVGEIEKAIYNITLPNQMGDKVIVYHARMVGRKDEQSIKIGTCCEGQGTRMIGSIPEYIYSIASDGLYVDLFAPSEITWQQDKQTLKVQMITGFPFDNNVALRFSLATPVAAKIRVRVPAWSAKPMAILVNNTREVTGVPGTYATLERTWNDGDSITFTLPAELRMTKYAGKEASETQPRYALEYGPILLAAVGAGADRAEASFACDSASLLSRIKPVAGQPLHFSIEGESNYSYIPYWEVASKQTFTCFPIVTGKQSPQPVEKK